MRRRTGLHGDWKDTFQFGHAENGRHQMFTVRQSFLGALMVSLASTLVGCVTSDSPFLDKAAGLTDPYFSGKFSYREGILQEQKTRNLQLTPKSRNYIVEQDQKLIGVATLHKFRHELFIVQLRQAVAGKGGQPFLYLLVRKTPTGFDVGEEIAGCNQVLAGPCGAKSKSELMSKIDGQATKLAENSHSWVSVQRGWTKPEMNGIAQSLNPSEDCNSDDRDRKLSGCSAIIEKGGLGEADLALAYSRRSDTYVNLHDFDRVISDRKRAIELQPNDAGLNMRMSGAYQLRAAAIAKQDVSRAIADLTEAVRIDPTNFEARLQRSGLYFDQHKLAEAIDDSEEAFKASATPANSEWLVALLIHRAAELSSSSDAAGAIAVLTRAIQLRQKDPELLFARGNAHAANGDFGRAIADYSDALDLKPDIDALLSRAEMYRRTGQLSREMADVDAAVSLNGKNVTALLARALLRESVDRYADARADYARVLALDPKQPIARAGLQRIRQEQEAQAQLEQLAQGQSLDPIAASEHGSGIADGALLPRRPAGRLGNDKASSPVGRCFTFNSERFCN